MIRRASAVWTIIVTRARLTPRLQEHWQQEKQAIYNNISLFDSKAHRKQEQVNNIDT